MVHDEDSMAADVMISSRRTARPGDSPRIPIHQQSTEAKTGPSNFASSGQQLPAAANVVTNLQSEDFDPERRDSRTRHLAQYILFSKEKKKQHYQARSSGVNTPNRGNRVNRYAVHDS